jgi:general secretion pathway protein A
MYAEFYNLRTMPFQLTPDSQFFFESKQHERALAHLIYGMAQEEGFIVITGEIGAGKTMLIERLWSELDLQRFMATRILTTQLSDTDLLKMVSSGFGLTLDSDKAGSLRRLEQLFTEARAAGKRCFLVIDEVQNLPIAALEELRMLSNITVGGQAPFQCLLLGQPQFRQMLSDARLEQLKQRVLASYHLGPLSGQETRDYVQHRLRRAGWSGDPSFDDEAFAAIHSHSGGIPRKINTVCSRVLLAGCLDETHQITEAMVDDVAEELSRDLSSGRATSAAIPSDTGDIAQTIDRRLAALETVVARHERAIKRTIQITAQLIGEFT